ncbi:MAG: tRNA epoxyqueuosine(34) reductase QueG [Myxococcota bacterium]
MSQLTPAIMQELARVAKRVGLLRMAAVRLDHPGFAQSSAQLDAFLDDAREGEMHFLTRTREVRKDPAQMLDGARTLLVALVPYDGEPGPIARYARSADYHSEMHVRLEEVCEALRARLPEAKTLICVDTKPVQERAAAALAGLGFIGKNGMLIAPGLGSFVLLGAIMTTAQWEGPDAPLDLQRVRWEACGACRRCLDACPTDAFVGVGELDPRRCISYLTIEHRGPVDDVLQDGTGERLVGCDVCQDVCPYNAGRSREARIPAEARLRAPAGDAREADPVALATIRSGRYRAFVRDTAMRRIPRRHMRRNALIVLGNRSGPMSASEREAVSVASDDDDAQVAAAARRVIRKRGDS